ncbi:MAG: class II aldolase/adducin family protein [Bacteroidales bacterium]|nr:class II aldolase/adducin family protein [Bacteroidales bacterium]
MSKIQLQNEINRLKPLICDIGRRMWQRSYVDGNGGNISVRITKDWILCTPTLISKGFMTPDDLCLVDMDGRPRSKGGRPPTSEILTHLAIYRNVPEAGACVHAHPPHATTFSITGVQPPKHILPEVEIFLGEIAVVPYHHPGSPEMAEAVGAAAPTHRAMLMQNHGAITWGEDVETAYWKMEILDNYCRMLLLAKAAGMIFTTIDKQGVAAFGK